MNRYTETFQLSDEEKRAAKALGAGWSLAYDVVDRSPVRPSALWKDHNERILTLRGGRKLRKVWHREGGNASYFDYED